MILELSSLKQDTDKNLQNQLCSVHWSEVWTRVTNLMTSDLTWENDYTNDMRLKKTCYLLPQRLRMLKKCEIDK